MIQITPSLSLDENELHFEFVRASGPGGQNVNKVATAVQLRFAVDASPSLPEAVKARLRILSGSRLNQAGELVIEARSFRTQEQNRQAAIERLTALLQQAARPPRPRRPSRVPAGEKRRRLEAKRRRGEVKRLRKESSGGDE